MIRGYGPTLADQHGDLIAIHRYLVEETLRRVQRVEEEEKKLDNAERTLRKWVDKQVDHGRLTLTGVPGSGSERKDLYIDAYKKDPDWINIVGALRWYMALADMFSGAAAAVGGLLHQRGD